MISVIIPCQEDGDLLVPTLKSIFLNKFPADNFEVLLARNSHIAVSRTVEQFEIKHYLSDFRTGAQAINFGVRKASGNIIAITKPGCIVNTDWLTQIEDFFHANPSVVGIGGPVFPWKACGSKIQRLASEIFYEEQHFPDTFANPTLGSYQALFHATNSAFRKEVLESTRFDESFVYDYDFDMCWKLLGKGRCLVYNPNMKVRYIFPANLNSLIRRYFVWGQESVKLKKRYQSEIGFLDLAYPYYGAVRAFLEHSPLALTQRILRFTQHLAFNVGRISVLGAR